MDRISGLNNFSISSSSIYQQHSNRAVDTVSAAGKTETAVAEPDAGVVESIAENSSENLGDLQQRLGSYAARNRFSSNPQLRTYQQISMMTESSPRESLGGLDIQI